jgi:malate synthase
MLCTLSLLPADGLEAPKGPGAPDTQFLLFSFRSIARLHFQLKDLTMTARTHVHGLQVATTLYNFVNDQVLPGTGVSSDTFWQGFDAIVADLAPKNVALLAERDRLQTELDTWHKAHPGPITDMPAYRSFLEKIGYLAAQPVQAKATTTHVDAELALQAGPQLVVPILNARYALNAANARWGSLYDALYGTDAIPETDGAEKGSGYNPVRGAKVIAFARQVLDTSAPLANGSHKDAVGYQRQRQPPAGRSAVRGLPR